jgi:Lrp/AsnC family transcriptional regulator for asnA, asnC and gidA
MADGQKYLNNLLHLSTIMSTSNIITMRDLKEIDKKILRFLIEDSHKSLNEIAERVGISRQYVSQRIKKLQDKGLIRSFTIDLNKQLIEELRVHAYILFREDPNTKIRSENEKKLKEIPQITKFSRLFGKYDGILELNVRDNDELTTIVNQLHNFEGIKETETFIVHTFVKDDENAPILNILQ